MSTQLGLTRLWLCAVLVPCAARLNPGSQPNSQHGTKRTGDPVTVTVFPTSSRWRIASRLRSPVFSLELVVVQIEGPLGYVMPTIGQQDGNYIVSIDLTGQKEPPIHAGPQSRQNLSSHSRLVAL